MTSWHKLAERVRRELTVVRDESERLLVAFKGTDAGECYVRVQRAELEGEPAVDVALVVRLATELPSGPPSAANDNVTFGKLSLSGGSLLLHHTLPLQDLALATLTSAIADLARESVRLSSAWQSREVNRVFAHFSE